MELHDPSESAENIAAASPGTNGSVGGKRSSGWAIALALAVIASAALAVYVNSFSGIFVYDDENWIETNTSIRHLWPIWKLLVPPDVEYTGGRPVVSLTLAINYALGETNVWGYHAMNLVIHVLAAWTLLGVMRRTLLLPRFQGRFASVATPLALAVALLWMIHPLQTESVTYVIQRTEALAGLFYLLTLYCVIRAATSSRSTSWYVAATAACLLGVATKEVMVTAPVIVLLYDRTFLAGSFREAWRRRWGLYLALAATWGLTAALLVSTHFYAGTTGFAVPNFTACTYLLTQPGVILHYLRLAFWPSSLCFDYGWLAPQTMSEIVVPGILLAGLLALTIWALVKRPEWGFLGAWFFVILAPTSSFVPIRDAAVEHRTYLSLAAVVAGVVVGGWMAGQWLIRRRAISSHALHVAGGILTISACVALGILTFHRNAVYQSKVSLWEDAAAKVPDNVRAHYNLGIALADCGRTEAAIAEYEKTLELAPDNAEAHNNLGLTLAGCSRLDEACVHYRKALEIKPKYVRALYNLALALVALGRPDEAIAEYQKALDIQPDFAEAHNNLATALLRSGRVDDAIVHFRKALELQPDCMETHYNLGLTLAKRGQFDEAIDHFRRVVEIKPDYMEAQYNLGLTLARRGRFDEAIDHFRKVVELKPDFVEGHNNLGNSLGASGRLDEAIEQFQKTLEIKPDYAEAHNNLGIALAKRGRIEEAVVHFRRALEIKPDFAAARRNLATTLDRRGNAR